MYSLNYKKSIRYFKQKGLSEKELKKLTEIANGDESLFRRIAQRRLFREPMAYIRGYAVFYGRKFCTDTRAYVPNPETEKMVSLFLKSLTDKSSVLDVGTGCGNIAITIKKEKPKIKVCASDIHPAALELAKENAKKHGVKIPFYESLYVDDLNIPAPTHIIADMPYGDERYILESSGMEEMQHMPPLAIFHPKGVLEAHRELINSIQKKGWHSKLFFETGKVEKEKVRKIIPENLNFEYKQFKNYSVTIVSF